MRAVLFVIPAVGLLLGAEQPSAEAKKELQKFEGTWTMVSLELNGRPAPDEAVKAIRATIKGDKVTIHEGEKTNQATISVDSGKNPKWLDAVGKEHGKEVRTIGIYKFNGDQLTICYTKAGSKRPTEFSSKGGTQTDPIVLAVYKRKAKPK